MISHSGPDSPVRVALYLRVSTGRQDHSIDSQRSELTRLIDKRPDHRIVAEYVDEAISGDDTDRRVGFLQMRDDAQAGRSDFREHGEETRQERQTTSSSRGERGMARRSVSSGRTTFASSQERVASTTSSSWKSTAS